MKKKLSALFWALAFGLVGLAYLSDDRMFYAILSWIFLAFSIGYFINLFIQIFQEPLDKWWDQLDDDNWLAKWWGKPKKKDKLRLKKKKKK